MKWWSITVKVWRALSNWTLHMLWLMYESFLLRYMSEVSTEFTIAICQLISSNDLERQRETNSGWICCPTLAMQIKSVFLLCLECGENGPARWSGKNSTLHLDGAGTQQVVLWARERICTTGHPVVPPVGLQRGHEVVGWKIFLDPGETGMWFARKNNHKSEFFQENCCSSLQWVVSQIV